MVIDKIRNQLPSVYKNQDKKKLVTVLLCLVLTVNPT